MQPVTPNRTFIKLERGSGGAREGETKRRLSLGFPRPLAPPLPRSLLLALLDDLEIDQPALDLFQRDAGRFGIGHVDARLGAFLNLFTAFRGDQNLAVFAVDRKRLHFFFPVLIISHLTYPLPRLLKVCRIRAAISRRRAVRQRSAAIIATNSSIARSRSSLITT